MRSIFVDSSFYFPENIPVLSSDKSYGLRNKPGGKCSVVDEKPFLRDRFSQYSSEIRQSNAACAREHLLHCLNDDLDMI